MVTVKQKIVPHLWFDKEAKEATGFYCSIFPDSKVTNIITLHDTPSGDCDVVSFELSGQPFMAISAGPLFKFNPSVSFIVNFDPSRDKNARKNLGEMMRNGAKQQIARVTQAFLKMKKFDIAELQKAYKLPVE